MNILFLVQASTGMFDCTSKRIEYVPAWKRVQTASFACFALLDGIRQVFGKQTGLALRPQLLGLL